MSRAGYSDDGEQWDLIKWRGQVASAMRGRRGQAFFREMVEALDALPEKRLIKDALLADASEKPAFIPPNVSRGEAVCAIGAVGLRRGVDMNSLDPEDYDGIARAFRITHQLVQEIEYMNDEVGWNEMPEARWVRMRKWIVSKLDPHTLRAWREEVVDEIDRYKGSAPARTKLAVLNAEIARRIKVQS
jgi:hypothetical protein